MSAFKYFRSDGLDQAPDKIGQQTADIESNQICKTYVSQLQYGKYFFETISIFVIVYNNIFYTVVEPAVCLIGHHVRTDQISLIANLIFGCLVLDMIFIPVFIGMNMVEHFNYHKVISGYMNFFIPFQGKYTDFNGQWYATVAKQITLVMILWIL